VNVGSLFSGIGGFDLGLERAGMRVVWQCEQDEFCRRVLARRFPGVPCYPDVRALVADSGSARRRQDVRRAHGDEGADEGRAAQDTDLADGGGESGGDGALVPVPVPYVDVLCGGFPCQDISLAGKGAGIGGERSGLWAEYARLIRDLRPRYVIVENVAALLARGLDVVLADLAACGYDAEWDCLPASAFGAPHQRDRLWLVAYPESGGGADGQGVAAGEALVGSVAGAGGRAVDGDASEGVRLVGAGAAGGDGRGGSMADPERGGRSRAAARRRTRTC
jgi:DNA (cytosine-5)-methyltransferase 1